jgi:hypothetical protein
MSKKKAPNPVFEWFKNLGLKIKIFFGALFGILGAILFFVFSKKANTKGILEVELKKVRKEIEIEKAASEVKKNSEKLLSLKEKADRIKKEIAEISEAEREEAPKEVSNEELDEFFDSRGL